MDCTKPTVDTNPTRCLELSSRIPCSQNFFRLTGNPGRGKSSITTTRTSSASKRNILLTLVLWSRHGFIKYVLRQTRIAARPSRRLRTKLKAQTRNTDIQQPAIKEGESDSGGRYSE